MDSAKVNPPGWRKYVSRFCLLMLLVVFIGCADQDCGGPLEVCGESVRIEKGYVAPIVLTDSNPTVRVITDDACACAWADGAEYSVTYQYHDIPTIPGIFEHTENATDSHLAHATMIKGPTRQATEKDKPSVIVKFGTLEKGVQNAAGAKKPKPVFGNGVWQVHGTGSPPKVKEGTTPAPIHYVLTVTMQRPLIRLPGKAPPTIVLPFIGPVIGPEPRDVDVSLYLEYKRPMEDE